MTSEPKKKNFMAGKHWVIVIIILVAGYQIYNGLSDLIESRRAKEQWTNDDYTLLVNKCIQETGDKGVKYYDLTRAYCECSNDKIKAKFSKQQYIEIIKKPTEEQVKILLPVFQDCLTKYQDRINELEK
ncbi:MAG TPA: hypothetical protein VIM65_10015 [Cyclobacteriaceae bacterium]